MLLRDYEEGKIVEQTSMVSDGIYIFDNIAVYEYQ